MVPFAVGKNCACSSASPYASKGYVRNAQLDPEVSAAVPRVALRDEHCID
jgi:hypothetical protein